MAIRRACSRRSSSSSSTRRRAVPAAAAAWCSASSRGRLGAADRAARRLAGPAAKLCAGGAAAARSRIARDEEFSTPRPDNTVEPATALQQRIATTTTTSANAAAAANWSASAWASGAPTSVHNSPKPEPLPREPPPRPRSSAPQAWGPTTPSSHSSGPDARACAAAFTAAAAMTAHPSEPGSSSRTKPGSASTGGGPPMAPPKETAREKRLQQQRDALSHAVGMAQSSAAEAAVRVELLRTELFLSEDMTARASALVAGGAAERAALRSQLDAMAAELKISRQANERLTADRLAEPKASIATGGAERPDRGSRAMSPAQQRLADSERARSRKPPIEVKPRKPLRSSTPPPGRGGGTAMVVSMKGEEGRQQKEEPGQEVMTQTADDDDVLGTAVPRAAQAELAGLRAEVEQLREQIKEAAARREREIEGGERARMLRRCRRTASLRCMRGSCGRRRISLKSRWRTRRARLQRRGGRRRLRSSSWNRR